MKGTKSNVTIFISLLFRILKLDGNITLNIGRYTINARPFIKSQRFCKENDIKNVSINCKTIIPYTIFYALRVDLFISSVVGVNGI